MEYIYKYKDHLGNVRMYFVKIPGKPGSLITREAGIKEENYFYPFGLKHVNYVMLAPPPISPTGKLMNN